MSIPSENVIFNALNHKIRREILRIIINRPKTYSQLLNHFAISSGKLNYHLKLLSGFISKDDDHLYSCTNLGQRSLELLLNFQKELSDEEFIELDTEDVETPSGKVPIRVDKMEDFSDSDRIQKHIRSGNIVLVKIKSLRGKDISELKRAIDKLRKTCIAINGDIAGIDEDWVILTPSFAHIARQ